MKVRPKASQQSYNRNYVTMVFMTKMLRSKKEEGGAIIKIPKRPLSQAKVISDFFTKNNYIYFSLLTFEIYQSHYGFWTSYIIIHHFEELSL